MADLNWQTILWREWRNTDNEAFAGGLYEALADKEVGRGATLGFLLFGALAGGMVAVEVSAWRELSAGLPLRLAGLTWPALLGSVWIGGVVSGLLRVLSGKRLIWRRLLERLMPKSSPDGFMRLVTYGLFAMLIYGALQGIEFWNPGVFACMHVVSVVIGLTSGFVRVLPLILLQTFFLYATRDSHAGLVGLSSLTLGVFAGSCMIASNHVAANRSLALWWKRNRPDPHQVEQALRVACELPSRKTGTLSQVLESLDHEIEHPQPLDLLFRQLGGESLLRQTVAAFALLHRGGEAAPFLKLAAEETIEPERRRARWILEGIAQETTARLQHTTNLVCPACFSRVTDLPLTITEAPEERVVYYGCPRCGQSRDFIEVPRSLVAVLDADREEASWERDGDLYVNLLARETLTDFDRVEIVKATDEDVEYFTMRIGNDTETMNGLPYNERPCLIAPDCTLSESTVHLLKDTLGEIAELRT